MTTDEVNPEVLLAAEPAPIKNWPTLKDAAAMLGMSERNLQRWIAKGRLEKREQPIEGRPTPLTLVNPADVEREMQNKQRAAYVMPAAVPINPAAMETAQVTRPQAAAALPAVITIAEELREVVTALRPREWTPYLPLPMAAEYSGLPLRYLLKAIRAKVLPAHQHAGEFYVSRAKLDVLEPFDMDLPAPMPVQVEKQRPVQTKRAGGKR